MSTVWLLADRERKDALPLTDQSLPEIDESLAPLGLVGSGGLFFCACYFAGTAIISSVVVFPWIPTPRTIAFEAAGGRCGS